LNEASPPAISFAERTIQLEPSHYDLTVDLDMDEKRLRGTATIRFRNASDIQADHVPLLLYRLMRVDAVRDENGGALNFTQRVETFEDWDRMQVNYLEIHPAKPLAPASETTVIVDWSGYPHSGVNRSAGLPDFDHDIRVTVPEPLVVASNGRLVDVEHDGDRATYTFRSIQPSWRMDVAVAPFEVVEEGGVRVHFLPGDRAGAEAILGGFSRAVGTFTEWFGPLPVFEGFNIIELPPDYGSQTDVTCILQTADAFRSTESLNELYHEASHLWHVTLDDGPSPRWEEGMASFLERLLIDVYAGDTTLGEVERVAFRIRERLRSRFDEEPRLSEIPMIDFGREEMTGMSYRVGMLMFGVLYHLVRPEEFNQVVGGFFQRYHVSGASTEQFVSHANEMTQVDLEPFFRDWLYGTDYQRFLDSEQTLAEIAETYR